MKDKSQEQRRYLRLDTVNLVKVALDQRTVKEPSEIVSAFTKNISVEGMCFLSDKSFDKGKPVRLEIVLPDDSDPLTIKGQVRWVRSIGGKKQTKPKFEIGIKLFTIEESDVTRFMGYVCNHMAARLGRYLHL